MKTNWKTRIKRLRARKYYVNGNRPWSAETFWALVNRLKKEFPRIGWKKLLWFTFQVDLRCFAQTGKSMTGAIWIRTPYGAVPEQLAHKF